MDTISLHLTRTDPATGTVYARADAASRPDGRTFVSLDTWDDAAFAPLVADLLDQLSGPLHTLVDATDSELIGRWREAGFELERREGQYVVASAPHDPAPPPGVRLLGVGRADPGPLRDLDRTLRGELGPVWTALPAEVVYAGGVGDPSRYAVAEQDGWYVGLLRLAGRPVAPRIGLLAVRADHRRRGVGAALLRRVLADLHEQGVREVVGEVDDTNAAALALAADVGARRTGALVELVRR